MAPADPNDATRPRPIELDSPTTQPPPAAAVDAYLGKTIDGRYLVEAVLGQGGMGIVYAGKHKMIDKKVAIKVLRGDMARDKEVTDRFLQEARAASAIGNPHIIDISDFGVLPDGATYFVMEYLGGSSLSKVLDDGPRPVPIARLLHIAKQIAQGLSAAHAAGIIHRDLKPDNVMLVDRGTEKDFVKILDFGIAKVQGGDAARLTRAGSVFGTPHYMSPEQAAGATVTSGTDIYSLGVILYEMASGKVPFDAENFMGIMTMHMYKAPVPMRALVPAPQEIPPGLDAVVLKCLSKKPEQRYASMDALVSDLEKLEKGLMPDAVNEMMARSGGFNVPADYFRSSVMPPPVPGSPRLTKGKSRWPLIAGIAGVATAILIVVAIFAFGNKTNATTEPTSPVPPPTTPATVAATTPTQPTAATATPEAKPVALAAQPADAKIVLDGKELKAPVLLKLMPGETQTVVVSRAGYATQTVVVTDKDDTKLIVLSALPGTRPGGGRPTGTAKPTGGGGLETPGLGPDPFEKHR
jgi:serine/threonine protein kinase